jgi:short-subunit dehydrogenase
MYEGEMIWIIGASSGIGLDLSKSLSKKGAKLILSARREDALSKLNDELGGQHAIYPLDVSSFDDIAKTTKAIFKKYKIVDRVIFMAGIYKPLMIKDIEADFAEQMMRVNFLGAVALVSSLLPYFEKQKKAQIVLCASVSGYLGLPKGQPYSASKAALINYAESLKVEVSKHIDVKLINPGFVRTRLTDMNKFQMPMIIESSKAADIIVNGLSKSRFEIHFPKGFTFLLKIVASLPYFLMLSITSKMAVDK